MDDPLGVWEPLSLEEVSRVLDGVGCPWWLAGGWAIDLHLGRTTRHHEDVDVSVLRDDQLHVQRHLEGWDLQAADPPGTLRPWLAGERLEEGVHDVWCRRSTGAPWSLQLMLDEAEDGEWVYRREPRVRRALASLSGPASTRELPVLAPEVQLLFKSTNPRPKDVADLHSVLGALNEVQRTWLIQAVDLASPGSPWLTVLRRPR